VSSIGSPYYLLACFLHTFPGPLAGKSESFTNNAGYFVQLSLDTLVSFDGVSLLINLPVDEQ
jgi:hypothetical protein